MYRTQLDILLSDFPVTVNSPHLVPINPSCSVLLGIFLLDLYFEKLIDMTCPSITIQTAL